MKANRVPLLRGALLWIFVVAGAANVAQAQIFAPAPSQVGPPLLPPPPHTPMLIPTVKSSPTPAFPATRRELNAGARIKIHAIAAFVKRIEAERSPAVIQGSYLKLSKTVPTAGQNGNPGPRAGALRTGTSGKERVSKERVS